MAEMTVTVNTREKTGKNESRRLRQEGRVPAVLYGEKKDPVALTVEARVVDRILHSKMGINTVFDLEMAGTEKRRSAMIKDYQLDPVTDRLVHADFIRIDASHLVHVPIHVVLKGTPIGVKEDGGILEFPVREIMVACLPKDIPQSIVVDVSELKLNQVIHVSDIPMPEGVTALSDKITVVCSVHAVKAEAEVTPTAAATVEGAAPAAGAEGAAAAPAAAGGKAAPGGKAAAPAAAKPAAGGKKPEKK